MNGIDMNYLVDVHIEYKSGDMVNSYFLFEKYRAYTRFAHTIASICNYIEMEIGKLRKNDELKLTYIYYDANEYTEIIRR